MALECPPIPVSSNVNFYRSHEFTLSSYFFSFWSYFLLVLDSRCILGSKIMRLVVLNFNLEMFGLPAMD